MIDLTGYRLVMDERGVVTECIPPRSSVECKVLGQRDPKWARVLLGNSQSSTIGGYGCLVTSMAILAGCTPDRINEGLRANGGFQAEPRGGYITYAGFTTAFEAASRACGARTVRFHHMSTKLAVGQPRPFGWLETLMDWLKEDHAIVEVDMDIKTTKQEQHFVAALPGKSAGNIEIIDPWDKTGDSYGRRQMLLPEYGRDVSSAVWRYILYEVK